MTPQFQQELVALTQVFTIREGEWRLLLDGVIVAADFNSKGAAEAAIDVERARRAKFLAAHRGAVQPNL